VKKDMKINIALGLIALALVYVTCKTFSKKPVEEMAPEAAVTVAPQSNVRSATEWRAAHVLGSNADTAAAVQIHEPPVMVNVPIGSIAPPTTSRRAYLSTGWWHCTMAFSGSDSLIHKNYQQKWLQFRQDQTFDILIKGKVVDTGKWAFDEEKNQFFLSCKDPYINNSWQVQDKGFVMVLKGNTDINFTGIQVRIACNKTQPDWN
jgi:hypothetical protein